MLTWTGGYLPSSQLVGTYLGPLFKVGTLTSEVGNPPPPPPSKVGPSKATRQVVCLLHSCFCFFLYRPRTKYEGR